MAGRVLSIKIALDFSDIKAAFSKLKEEIAAQINSLGDAPDLPAPNITPPDTKAFNFNQIVQATEQVSAAVEALSGPFREFDKALRDIGSLGVKNFKDLEDSILSFSKTVPDAAADIASAIGEGIGSGVIKTDEAGNVNPAEAIAFAQTASQLAVAGGSSIGKAVSGIAATLNSYGMAATEAGRVSDVLFNTFNLGVTSVDDLAGYLSQVTPVAAAAGVSFEQVAATIATMTKQGIKTSDATTKIRAFLVEMQKPTPALTAVLNQAGVSIEKIKSGELSLQSAAAKIGTTITALGKSAPQVFSSIEAATTVLSLSGSNAATAMEDLEGIAKRGSVAEGFAVQAEGAEVKMKVLMNNVQAGFISFFSTVGSGLTAALGGIAQAAPTIATFANLKNLFPASMSANIAKFATSLLSTLVPSLFVTNTATGALTFSFGALWTAITGPIGIAVAAILAVGAALYLLYNNVEPVRKVIDAIIGGIVGVASSVIDAVGPALSQVGSLITDIGGLIFQWVVLPFRVGWEVITAIWEAIAGLTGGIDAAGSSGNALKDIFSFIRNVIIGIQGIVAGLSASISAVVKGIGDSVGKLLSGDILGAAESFFGIGESAADAFSKGMGKKVNEELAKLAIDEGLDALENRIAIRGDLDKAGKLAGLRKQLADAKTDAEKANITAAIAKEAPGAVESIEKVVDANGKVREVIKLNEEALDDFAKTAKENGEEQNEDNNKIVLGILAQGDAYNRAKAKLKEQQDQIAQRKAAGLDTEQLEKDLADQQKVVASAKADFEKSFTAAKATGVFDNLDEEGKRMFANLQASSKESIAAIETELRDKKLGEALAQATTINQKIDAQDQIGKFVEQYKNAKTDVERANLAKAIGEQVPQAITAYDALGNATGINVEKAAELAEANKKTYGADLLKQQDGFTAGLKGQADELTANRAKMEDLQKQISKANDPKEIQRLQAEYATLKGKVGENVEKLQETVQEGKKVGLIKGDVKDLGTEFKLSGEQAKSIGVAVEGIKDKTDAAVRSAADLAKAYKDASSEIDASFQANFGAIRALQEENQKLQAEAAKATDAAQKAEIQKRIAANSQQIADMKRQAREEVRVRQENARQDEALRYDLGDKERKREEKKSEDLSQFQEKLQKDAAKTRAGIASDAIADEIAREKQKKQDAAADALRQLDEDLGAQKEKISKATKDKKDLVIGGKVVTQEQAIAAAEQAIADARKAVEERLVVDLAEVDKQAREKRLDGYKKDLGDQARLQSENAKIIADGLKAELDGITGETETAATERLAKRLEILQQERAAAVNAALLESEAYQNAYAEIQLAQSDLLEASTEGEKAAAQARVAVSRAALLQVRADLIASNPGIVRVIEQNATEQARAMAEGSRAIEEARERDRIAMIEDAAEQERALRLLELQKKEADEVAAAEGNEVKLREIAIRGAQERAKIEEDYRKKSSVLWRAYYAVLDALNKAFQTKVDKDRQKQLDEEKAKLADDEQALREQLKRKEISLEQYNQKVAALQQERLKIAEEERGKTASIEESFRQAGIAATAASEQQQTEIATRARGEYVDMVASKEALVEERKKQLRDKGLDESLAAGQIETESAEQRTKALENTLSEAGTAFISLVAQGENASKAMATVVFDGLQKSIPAIVAAIFGESLATLGPILGPIASATVTAAFYGLVAIARSSVEGNAAGDVAIEGPGTTTSDSILRRLSRGESVLTAASTAADGNADAYRWANRTGKPLHEYYGVFNGPKLSYDPAQLSDVVVTMQGHLQSVGQATTAAMDRVAMVEQQQVEIAGSLRRVEAELSLIRSNTAAIAGSGDDIAKTNRQMAKQKPARSII